MTLEEFWENVDEYLEVNDLKLNQLNKKLGFRHNYLGCLRLRKGRLGIKKLVKFKGILSDDVLYEAAMTVCLEPSNPETIELMENFIVSLKISKELREKQRLRRRLMRENNYF